MTVSAAVSAREPAEIRAQATTAAAADSGPPASNGFEVLCLLARLHQIAADPAALRHQLGKVASHAVDTDDYLLLAARHLGLKAQRSRSETQHLYTPEQGRVLVDGVDISLIDAARNCAARSAWRCRTTGCSTAACARTSPLPTRPRRSRP